MTRLVGAMALACLLQTTGCRGPAEAPEDLDGLARFFFNRFAPKNDDLTDADPAASDAEIQDGIARLHDVLDGDALNEPQLGTLADITAEELATAGLPDADPTPFTGASSPRRWMNMVCAGSRGLTDAGHGQRLGRRRGARSLKRCCKRSHDREAGARFGSLERRARQPHLQATVDLEVA